MYLFVKPGGARSWMLRVQADGKRRDIGLGSVEFVTRADADAINIPLLHRKTLTLTEARDKCALLRKAAQAGLDPVLERDKDRRGVPTFEQATLAAYSDLKSKWSSRHQETFLASLRRHAFPALGARRVDQIQAADIIETLKPIWSEKVDMGRKVSQRIALVLNYSNAQGWRKTETPSNAVAAGLPTRTKKGGNYAAMPYSEVPAYVSGLQAKTQTIGRLALLFTIYTAARSGEVRKACWSQIDATQRLWNRPASMMKAGESHSVTLSEAALTLLKQVKPLRCDANDLIFPSGRGTPLSDATLSKIVRDDGLPYTVHGFRSSFRDWAAEQRPNIPDPVAEAALAHVVPDRVVRAYKRTTFVEMRRQLLADWAVWLASGPKHVGEEHGIDEDGEHHNG